MRLRATWLALPFVAAILPAVASADSFLSAAADAAGEAPAPAVPVVASSSSRRGAGSFAEALNAYRAQHGLGALREDAALSRVAQAYAEDMASHGYFSHTARDGATVTTRARRAGCQGRGHLAENIAWGQPSAEAVLSGWAARSGHRENMLGREYGVFGLGESGGYWVLTFADAC